MQQGYVGLVAESALGGQCITPANPKHAVTVTAAAGDKQRSGHEECIANHQMLERHQVILSSIDK